jgi:hypothetical protein
MKKSRTTLIREMKAGEQLSFPILSLESVRNCVHTSNAIFFKEGKRWLSHSIKEEGIIVVERIS